MTTDGTGFYDVEPEVGLIFVHDHRILHSGEPISGGTKYVIRTDIMFSTKPLSAETDTEDSSSTQKKAGKNESEPTK